MREVLALAVALMVGANSAPPNAPAPDRGARAAFEEGCRVAVRQVDAPASHGAGLTLQRGAPATGGLIAAVDYRLDGCRVLRMARASEGFRPEPKLAEGKATLRPLE